MLSCIRLFVTYGLSARIPCPWDFPDKNTGVGCHFLLQAIIMINLNKKNDESILMLEPLTECLF